MGYRPAIKMRSMKTNIFTNISGALMLLTLSFIGCTDSSVSNSERLFEIIASNKAFMEEEFSILGENYDKLPGMDAVSIKRRADFAINIVARLDELDASQLESEDQITLKLFHFVQSNAVAQFQLNGHLNPILLDDGFHISFAFTADEFSFTTVKDYENYFSVLRSFPKYTEEHIALMRKGLEIGMCQPKVVLEGYEVTFDNHIVENAEESFFYTPLKSLPANFTEDEKTKIRFEGKEAIMNGAVKGYQLFSDFMKLEFMPNTRETIGAKDLPHGEEFYKQRINYYTTLELSPDSIHRLGLQEVARIKGEMEAIIKEVNFEGTFAEFLTFLRTDEQFYAKTPEELIKHTAWIAKSMDGKLPKLFGKLPRQPYTVNPVPDHLAPKYTSGRYVPASLASQNPGQYWINTYALENRPLYVMEALSFHEAVPGHHLQEALSRELTHLPEFRQSLYLSAFGEGWGLYSEFLGREAGFYKDPYSRFGRLTYEMWRACRLVVDTGLHAKGWTRQRVMDYMADHTALSIHEITTETDRYISWPAQALSYKIGELKIKALRKKATDGLGADFDIRAFHDLILSKGTVTLTIMEEMVDQFIQEKTNQ